MLHREQMQNQQMGDTYIHRYFANEQAPDVNTLLNGYSQKKKLLF